MIFDEKVENMINKIILDECSTVVEIDRVRNRKPAKKGKMDDIWLEFLHL